jgi:hypothetical protein
MNYHGLFPLLPLLLCFAGICVSIACKSDLGAVLSFIGTLVVIAADAYLLKKRAERPDVNPWDEI